MRKIYCLLIFSLLLRQADAQDNCSSAVALCASSLITRTTTGATASGTDPAITCGDNTVNNSVWFTVLAINNGNCTISVTNIDNNPGLEMQVYTGSCGSLTPLGPCASGSSATGGSMSMSFATTAGTNYYIMVDGTSGNQEAFNIVATTSDDAIVARPDANFSTNLYSGCNPLTVNLQNSTTLHGGSNITYDWRFDAGPYIPSSGSDTSITLNVTGIHTVTWRVCNTQCGCKTVSQDIVVQDLFTSISYTPQGACIGTDITFTGSAAILPDPPYLDPAVTNWDWNFGDPASGASNTANGQVVNHTFSGSSNSYVVTLITQGNCGPETTQTTIVLRPRPIVDAGPDQIICEGTAATLSASTSNMVNPIVYSWSGPGTFSCPACQTTDLSNLAPGGPYTATISVVDSFLCTADTTVNITVNPKPVVDAGLNQQVCQYSNANLNAVPIAGTAPFTYSWTPPAGLSNSSIANPVASVSAPVTYCVEITDSIGCMSDPDCVDIDIYPKPTINTLNPVLCATSPNLQNTFTVSGAGAGSVYSWGLSPDYSLITGANADSSSIDVTFPTGVAASYTFTAVVVDGITLCRDTVSTVFTVTNGLTMSISGPVSVCRGDIISLAASGATSYAWTANPSYTFADSSLATQSVSPIVSTIFTVTGTSGSCTQTITHSVTVNPKPIAAAQPLAPICGCSTISLDGTGSTAGMIYHWSSAAGSIISDTSALITQATACAGDVFTLLVIDPSSACFEDSSISLQVLPKPDASVLVSPDLICSGVSTVINLDGSGSNTDPGTVYHWTSSPIVPISDTTAQFSTGTVNNTTIFYLTVTDSLGCDSTASDTVMVYPVPSFVASSSYLCTTDTPLVSTLEIYGTAPGSVYDWTLIPPCANPDSTDLDSQTFNFDSCGAGTYAFAVTVTDAINACVYNLTQQIQVVNGVTLTVSSDTSFCEGGTATLNVSGANSFLWSTSDTSSSIVLPSLTATGSPYTYYVTGTIGGCSASDSVKVTVYPVPLTSAIAGPATVCEGDTAITYDVSPAGNTYTWTINGGQIVSGQGTNVISVNWDSAGTGTLSVVDTNSFGCPGNTVNITVNINAKPDSSTSIQGLLMVCSGSDQTYFVIPNAGSAYTWTVTGGTIIGSNISDVITVTWGNAGTGTLSVIETNANSCQGPVIIQNVNINPKPAAPIISGNQSVCDSSQSSYWTSYTAGSQYNWSVFGGSISNISSNQDSIMVSWTGSGSGVVSVYETNSFGCNGDSTIYTITVSVKPQASVQPDSASVCQNASIALTGTAIGSQIQWISSGTGTFDNSTIATPVYSPGNLDTGYVQLQMIVSSFPCLNDTATVILHVSPAPVVSISGTMNTICFGQNDTLTAQGGGSYLWSPGGSTNATIVVSPPVTTTYQVSVTNNFGCTSNDSVTVTVNPPGIPDAGSDQLICRGDSALFYGTQQGGGGYRWSGDGDGTFIPNTSAQQVTYVPGSADTANGFVNIVLVTTGYCLNLTDTLRLQINELPTVDAGTDTTITSGSGAGVAIPLSPAVNNATGVYWTSSGSGSFSPSDTSLQAVYTPSDQDFDLDSVIITAMTIGGCTNASDFLVIEFTPFKIPNVFTPYPNSPGFNDYFEIRNLPKNTELKVWNRWGLLVYSTEDYLNNWEAVGLPEEVYYYALKTARKEYKGWVQIIRN